MHATSRRCRGVFDLSGGRSTYWNDPYGENNEQWLPGQGTVDIT